MKKFLSWLLVISMVIGLAPAVFATESAKEEYIFDDTVSLVLGDNAVTLNENAYTTVFAFTPDEAATYTFSVPEGYLVGYWGGSEHYMWDSTGDAKTTTLVHTVTAVGQSVMVGITGEGAATLTVTKGNAYETVEIELQTYVNKATPTAPELDESATVEYVDVMGETTHTAVLGSDGYYHLDSAEGAILIVDMDYLYRLADALDGGRGVMYAYVTDENGNITEKWDIGDAVLAYEEACDENGYCYLTEDLMFFYGEYAEASGVYTYALGDGYNEDCAWMYACLTVADSAEDTVVSGSGTGDDPYILQINAYNKAVVAAGEGAIEGENVLYFYWEATADGTLTLTFDESDPEPYVTFGMASGNGGYTHEYTVSAGDVVYFCVETYDFGDADYTFYAAFEGETGEEGGDEEVIAEELSDGDNYLYIWAGEGTTPYTYTATQTGTLYLTFTEFAYMSNYGYSDCSDYLEGYIGMDEWGYENWTALTINGEIATTYYGCVDVTEGDVIAIGWEYYGANDYVKTNYDLYATLNLNYEGYKIPEPGSIDDPYEMYMDDVDWGYSDTVEIPAASSVYYYLYSFYGSTVTLTGEGDFAVKVATYEYDEYYNEILVWTTYTAEDGYLEFYADSYQLLVEIVNNSDAAAVYTVGYYYPVGHVENPQIIVGEGEWTASLGMNSDGYYYQWSMGDDTLEGIMTITVSGTNGSWQYYVYNYGQYIDGDYHYSDQDGQATENWTVFAGDYFRIWVSTDYNDIANYDYETPAGDVTITITFEEKELVQGVDYPYSVDFSSIYYYGETPEVPVAGGEEAWINVYGFEGYTLVVYGAGASVTIDGVTYTDEDADGVLKIDISSYDVDATLANTGSEDVTYSFGYEIPVGHEMNPHIITENGEYSTTEFVAGSTNQYNFQYTATEDGTITVEVLNDTYWRINLWNKSSYASAGSNYKYATSNTFTLTVSAGDVVSIYGCTYSYDTYENVAGVLSFNFTFEKAPEVELEYETLVLGDNTVGFDNSDGANTPGAYSYTAEQDGTLYLTLSDISYYSYSSYNGTQYGPYDGKNNISTYTKFLVNGEALSNGYYGTVEVQEGDVVTVVWSMKYTSYTYIYGATLNLSYEGYNPAPGSEKDPYELSAYSCPAATVEIPANSTVYYNLKYFTNSNITVTGEGAYIIYNGETYTDTDGDGVVMLFASESPMLVQIGNSGNSAAVFTVDQYYPEGHQMNPVTIESDGTYTATVDGSGDAYYFEFEADCDCDITLTFNSEAGYQYAFVLNGMSWDETAEDWNYMGAYNPHTGEFSITFELMQYDYVQIIVNTQIVTEDWDVEGLYGYYPAGTINMDVAFEYYHADDDEDGICDKCGADLNEVTVLYGDVDGNGEVDLLDANLIVSYYNGTADLTEEQLLAADVTGEGEVDLLDANQIVSYYNGTLESFGVENEG